MINKTPLRHLRNALIEVEAIRSGAKKFITFDDFLDELCDTQSKSSKMLNRLTNRTRVRRNKS
jgi:hypothetical protein